MTQTTRPPFVLCIAGDQQGCGHHRIFLPLASMVETGVVDGRIDTMVWPDEVAAAARPDVVVWQRQVEDDQIAAMERWRKMLPDALFVYELDDYLGEIPPASFHAGFMPPDLSGRISRAMAFCDRATTTTPHMADWLRLLGMNDVRVVPNGLPAARLKEREFRTGRIRVGFAGGISHAGDLELIRPAMQEIGDTVDWVFFGMQPENPPVRTEFHEGVPVGAYLDTLAKLNVDLFLAPLEDNIFNRCKSNLRLVEAASVGACVIAQDMPPYHIESPPVFAYATTPEDWTAAIRTFMAALPAERRRSADALRAWTGRHFLLERLLAKRLDAWLPAGAHWKPSPPKASNTSLVMSSPDAPEAFLRKAHYVDDGLEHACAEAVARGADVLWLRAGTVLDEACVSGLKAALRSEANVASAVPLASDGSNAFPIADQWTPMPVAGIPVLADIVRQVLPHRRLAVPAPSGPCVMLSGAALSMLGIPDVDGCGGNEEQAILEWGLRAAMREWRHVQAADAFAASVVPPAMPGAHASLRLQARSLADRLRAPAESLSAEERERIEFDLLRRQWAGPHPGSMGFGTDYAAWKALRETRTDMPALSLARLDDIGVIGGAYFGTDGPGREWIVWSDEDVTLTPDAFVVLADAIAKAGPDAQVIYADHESVIGDTAVPEFKPDFDLDLFLAQDYVTPVCAVRNQAAVTDRFDLFGRILDVALEGKQGSIVHIPRMLGAMKVEQVPERAALDALGRQVAIEQRLGTRAKVTAHKRLAGCLAVTWDWQAAVTDAPLVSIVIPTLGSGRLIQPCVNTIRQHTAYPNFEILVVQNGSREEPELGVARDDPRVRVLRWNGGFNWAAINNWAIRMHARGDYILCMNDDCAAGSRNWLDTMMGQAMRPDVGSVGARLIHPMGFVQHVGVVAHRGIAGHMHKGMPNGQPGHLGRAMLSHEASAVTGACMLFSRRSFDAVGGFDETMPLNFNDTDFCLRLRHHGLRNVVEMAAELLHPEAASRGGPLTPAKRREMRRDNQEFRRRYGALDDPFWNPALAIGLVENDTQIRGLNAEMLAWDYGMPSPDTERVLLINDAPGGAGKALGLLRTGTVPFAADLSGFRLRLTAPSPRNAAPWDVRDPIRMAAGLKALGITAIAVCSLVGAEGPAAPVESLRCLASLGLPVEASAEAAPGDDEASSPFGAVDRGAWLSAYQALAGIQKEAAE